MHLLERCGLVEPWIGAATGADLITPDAHYCGGESRSIALWPNVASDFAAAANLKCTFCTRCLVEPWVWVATEADLIAPDVNDCKAESLRIASRPNNRL